MAASSTKLDVPIVRRRSVLVEIAEIVEDDARSITTVVDQVELVVAIINGQSTGAEGHAPSYRSEISLRDRHADRGPSVFDSRPRTPPSDQLGGATGWWT
jgi:hypothetical protein